MFTTLKDLLYKIKDWFEKDIPDRRLANDEQGRKWFLKSINYSKTLKLQDLREVTDRKSLNALYMERFKNEDVQSRKGVSALKQEISALYSFNKSFVQRYKGRMHFYRDDLSQKGARNMSSVGYAFALFKEFKKNLDN